MRLPKIGDRVRRIERSGGHNVGPTGTIIAKKETKIRVQWDGSLRRWLRRDTEGKSWEYASEETNA